MNTTSSSASVWQKHLKWPLGFTVGVLAVLTTVHLLQWVLPLNHLGIHPRTFQWSGLLLAPLLHGSWAHLWGNASVLALLLPMCLVFFRSSILWALPVIWVVSFAWVWLFGAPATVHVGASGVVYGLAFFAMSAGVFQRSWWAVLGSLLSVVVFSYFLNTLFSFQEGVSFAAHFGGALGGLLASFLCRSRLRSSSKAS